MRAMQGVFAQHDVLAAGRGRQPTSTSYTPASAVRRQRKLTVASAVDVRAAPPSSEKPPALQAPASTSASGSNSNLWSYVSETTTSLATGLLAQFRIWPEETVHGPATSEEVEAQLRQTGKALQEASRQTKEEHAKTVPPDIAKFLQPTDVKTIKLVRVMSALSAMTYMMHQLTPSTLRRKLKLELVTTSKACERCVYEHTRSAEEVAAEGDGMAVATAGLPEPLPSQSSQAPVSNIVAIPPQLKFTAITPVAGAAAARWRSPAEVVQSKLSEAAEAAASASAAAIAPFGSAAEQLYKATQDLVAPRDSVDRGFHYSAAKGVLATTAASPASLAPLEPSQTPPAAPTCPSEWFICDDVDKEVRYFVIQGSDSIDHWRCNLSFDPVQFEDAYLGVKVHRGVYDAALAVYDRFLPLVQEQLDLSPFSKVCFTGHSIGGSLATVLMLMFRHRGVLPADRVAPVYTFGAPSVFCDGQATCSECSDKDGTSGGVLEKMGLKTRDVCNVIMSRDIVPRAFACDYSLVADILKNWGPAFRDHCCLGNESRKLMYNFIGKMLVLQPDQALTFASQEPYHPMLPEGPGIYSLVQPYLVSTIMAKARREAAAREGWAIGKEVPTLRQAILELMDTPHPLETLYDAGAYGPAGSISRYHNPDNYTVALGAVIRDKQLKVQQRLQLMSGASRVSSSGRGGSGNGDRAGLAVVAELGGASLTR